MISIHTVGRRKTAVARLYFRSKQGEKGRFIINGRDGDGYLNNEILRLKVRQPFDITGEKMEDYDILVNVRGGGITGQAEAIRLALSRALEKLNVAYRPPLKKAGLLKVDARQVERKKYGRPKARKSFQFSKR